jgi:hypothetical protein
MTHPGPHVNVEDKATAYKCDIQMPTPKPNPNERLRRNSVLNPQSVESEHSTALPKKSAALIAI